MLKLIAAALVSVASALILTAGLATAIHLRSIDGVDGWLLSLTREDETVYAPGYSDSGFRRVRRGMPVEEVHFLLGPPLDTSPSVSDPTVLAEHWSRSRGYTNYRSRVVMFRNGRVTRKRAEFYVE